MITQTTLETVKKEYRVYIMWGIFKRIFREHAKELWEKSYDSNLMNINIMKLEDWIDELNPQIQKEISLREKILHYTEKKIDMEHFETWII